MPQPSLWTSRIPVGKRLKFRVNVHGLIGHTFTPGRWEVVDQMPSASAYDVTVGSLVNALTIGDRDVFKRAVRKEWPMNPTGAGVNADAK